MSQLPAISLICWVDRHNPVLETTLHGYARQSCPQESFELIVADSDAGSDLTRLVLSFNGDGPGQIRNLSYLRTRHAGRADRNNHAAGHARGPLMAFVASDFIPCAGFVGAHLEFHAGHSAPECVGIGAVRSPPELRARSDFLAWSEDQGVLFGIDLAAEPPSVPEDFFYCGNASIKTAFFRQVGGFDEDFPYDAWDDFEFGLRARASGMRSALVPGAIATHNHLLEFGARQRQMELAGRSAAVLAQKYPQHKPDLARLWRQRWWMLQAHVRHALTRSPQDRRLVWRLGLQVAFTRGYAGASVRAQAPAQ